MSGMEGDDDLVNKGVIIRPGRTGSAAEGRTFLISGIGRGGTTMIAALLREAGFYFGENVSDLVSEDREMIGVLSSRDPARLDALIARNNAHAMDWAMKAPGLMGYFPPQELSRFRNPHLILVFRDPVAIAVRHAAAEHVDALPMVRDAANAMAGLADFAAGAHCPVMLLSYEKAITFPDALVEAVIRFCDMDPGDGLRERLLKRVEPNAERYITAARRRFQGMLDLVWQWRLHGWCWEVGSAGPLDVDICLDGKTVAAVRADQYRDDLKQAGIGDGHHAFSIDLASLGARADSIVSVRVSGRTYELSHSGRPVCLLPGFTATDKTRTA
jgi:hypothetical protein